MNTQENLTLIVCRSGPYGTADAKEGIDLVLALATFEQPVALLFRGDACYQLMTRQQSEAIESKALDRMLNALPIYGVDALYVEQAACELRHLRLDDLSQQFKALSGEEVNQLYQRAKTVLHF